MEPPQTSHLRSPIEYIGNKSRVASAINRQCASYFSEHGAVLDLFAGSGSCAREFAKFRPVVANDIQTYSVTVNAALLCPFDGLRTFIERRIVNDALSQRIWELQQEFSHWIEEEQSLIRNRKMRHNTIREAVENIQLRKPCQPSNYFVFLYGGVYFSLKQACEIQAVLSSLRECDESARSAGLACLISAASRASLTVGNQFAQPRIALDKDGQTKRHFLDSYSSASRNSVINLLISSISIYEDSRHFTASNQVSQLPDIDAIKLHAASVDFVYADPPYGREHYSRFYHVLETIARMDSPSIINNRTRMREDRFQSDYSKRAKAKAAFQSMICMAASQRLPIAISYADDSLGTPVANRVMPLADIIEILRFYYSDVHLEVISDQNFSQFNSNSAMNVGRKTKDCLLIAKNSKAH